MDDKKTIELKAEDVFYYVETERKKNKSGHIYTTKQKTKSGITLIFFTNFFAIIFALIGFVIVYNIFKAKDYKLIGSEKSIKGLESVLIKELQKKTLAELEEKQRALVDAQNRILELNDKIEAIKAEQERIIKDKLEKLKEELNKKMLEEMKNKTRQEQEEIRKKYEEELNKRKNLILEESKIELKIKEDELNKLNEEKKKLEEIQRKQNELIQKANQEYEKKLRDLKIKEDEIKKLSDEKIKQTDDNLNEIRLLKEREIFYKKIDFLFEGLIKAFNNEDYNAMNKQIQLIKSEYSKIPENLNIPDLKINNDLFFLKKLQDYTTFMNDYKKIEDLLNKYEKENKILINTITNLIKEKNSLQNIINVFATLNDIDNNIRKGVYEQRGENFIRDFERLKAELPQISRIIEYKDRYEKIIQDREVRTLLQYADNLSKAKKNREALQSYLSIIDKYPANSYNKDILIKISNEVNNLITDYSKIVYITNKEYYTNREYFTNYLTLYYTNVLIYTNNVSDGINIEEENKKAKPLYDSAVNSYNRNSLNEAKDSFVKIISQFPSSIYTKDSLKYIEMIYDRLYQDKYNKLLDEKNKNLSKEKKERDEEALKIYNQALALERSFDYDGAKNNYLNIIKNYYDTGSFNKAIEGIERVIMQKYQQYGVDKKTGYAKQEVYSIGKVSDLFNKEITIIINKDEQIKVNDILYVYRKATNYKLIAEVKITEISPMIIKAVVVKLEPREFIKIGDLVFKEKF